MLDWLRERRKSAETRREEQINAYVDGELDALATKQFESEMRADSALEAEVVALRRLRGGLQMLPRQRAPRNFTLDPAIYGKPERAASPLLYPAMRVATVLTAIMLISAFVLTALNSSSGRADLTAMSGGAESAAIMEESSAEFESASDSAETFAEAPAPLAAPAEKAAASEMADEAMEDMLEEPAAEPAMAEEFSPEEMEEAAAEQSSAEITESEAADSAMMADDALDASDTSAASSGAASSGIAPQSDSADTDSAEALPIAPPPAPQPTAPPAPTATAAVFRSPLSDDEGAIASAENVDSASGGDATASQARPAPTIEPSNNSSNRSASLANWLVPALFALFLLLLVATLYLRKKEQDY